MSEALELIEFDSEFKVEAAPPFAALFIIIAVVRRIVATDEAVTGATSETTTRSDRVPDNVALRSAGPGSGLDGRRADKLDEDAFDFLITSPILGESEIGPKMELSAVQRRYAASGRGADVASSVEKRHEATSRIVLMDVRSVSASDDPFGAIRTRDVRSRRAHAEVEPQSGSCEEI